MVGIVGLRLIYLHLSSSGIISRQILTVFLMSRCSFLVVSRVERVKFLLDKKLSILLSSSSMYNTLIDLPLSA